MGVGTPNDKFLISLGRRVRKLRLEKGLSMDDLALECDLEKSQIYRIENGKISPQIKTIKLIADGLQISLSDLFIGI
jgi:transcriptional regulator with XRE-family HTH domain